MKLSAIRTLAFSRQQGRCYYCGCLMWQSNPDQFAQSHSITLRQARAFQCTAEHLIARCDGGSDHPSNIAAACIFCNSRRHLAARPLGPEDYRSRVQRRMEKGGWHVARPV